MSLVPSGPGPERAPLRPDDGGDAEDLRGQPAPRPEGPCANHPLHRAEAACAECGKALCAECFYASGGGHVFCKECMEASRLVDAEPLMPGRAGDGEVGPPAGGACLAVAVSAWILALAAAAFVLWALFRGKG